MANAKHDYALLHGFSRDVRVIICVRTVDANDCKRELLKFISYIVRDCVDRSMIVWCFKGVENEAL